MYYSNIPRNICSGKKTTLEIIAIISIAVLGLRLLSYVVAPKSDSGINEITENKTRKDIKGSEK